MRFRFFSVVLATAISSAAATLEWQAAPPSPNYPPAVSYVVYSSTVTGPAAGDWSPYGNTTSLTFPVSGNAYRMFRVTGVSALGTESDPSNIVTNGFAKPGAPTNSNIRASIEWSPTPLGPWLEATNLVSNFALVSTNQFYRSRMTLLLQ